MNWMRAPGEAWASTAASFLGMWIVMTMAMMLPSLVPMLLRYRRAVGRTGTTQLAPLTTLVAVGYFFVWAVWGMAIFPLGAALAEVQMRHSALARVVPLVTGAAVVIAGMIQFTAWKSHHLARCREEPVHGARLTADGPTAWRQGLRFGLHCVSSCANLTAILLVLGVTDVRAMALVMAAVTAERLAPSGEQVARAIGALILGMGVVLIARATVL
jgi:predicted metal-binding membrane protein